MLYEIISPDAFLRPFIDDYTTLSSIYAVVRNAYAKKVYVDQGVPEEDERAGAEAHRREQLPSVEPDFVAIDADTIELIKTEAGGDGTKVINLIKSIEKTAEENSDDPFLIAMAERPKPVQESFEDRQTTTADALAELLAGDRAQRAAQEGAGRERVRWADVLCLPHPVGCRRACR